MAKKNNRAKLLIFTLVALLFVTTLMGTFGYLMYRKHLYGVDANLARVQLTNTTENITYGVSFGKSIEKYYGMRNLLNEARDSSQLLEDLYVISAQGQLLYASEGAAYPQGLKFEGPDEVIMHSGDLYSSMELVEGALMVARMDGAQINQALDRFMSNLIRMAVLIDAAAAVVMVLLQLVLARVKNEKLLKNLILSVMILSIVALGAYVGLTCWEEYEASYQLLADGVAQAIKQDIAKLHEAGIAYSELYGMEEYLDTYADAIPEFEKIVLTEMAADAASGDYVSSFEIPGGEQETVSFKVNYGASRAYMQNALLQYVLNTILLSMVALLIITEYSMFNADGEATATADEQAQKEARDYHRMSRMVRLFFFIMYACLKIGMSLDAIVARELCVKMGESSSALIGLPTTTAMMGAICAVVFSPILIRYLKGLKAPLIISTVMAIGGLAMCAFATNIYTFTAARFMTGFGEGLGAMLLKNIAAMQPSSERRKSFLAKASGGTFAGMCMGSVMGGMLNDQLSRVYVYLIGAVVLLVALALATIIRLPKPAEEEKKASVVKGIARVFGHLPALRYLICIVVPVYVCAVFLDYVLPLAGSDFGFSTTLISTLILAYSLIAGYAAPAMTTLAGKIFPTASAAAVAYSLLTGLVILLYPVFNSALFLIIAIVMMGVCDSFGVVYLNEGFIMAGKDAPYDRNIGNTVFTMVCKSGSMVAPYCIAFVGSYMALPITVGLGLAVYAATGLISRATKKRGADAAA